MNIKGQGHSLTLVQGHSDSVFSNFFSFWSQISCGAAFGLGERRLVEMVPVTWPRWPPCPIYGENLSLLCCNRKADDLESWYATSSTQVLPSLFKWCPWFDLDLFYDKVKFDPLCFCMGEKNKTMDFSETIVVYGIKVGRWSQLGKYMKLYEHQRSRTRTILSYLHASTKHVASKSKSY